MICQLISERIMVMSEQGDRFWTMDYCDGEDFLER